MRWRAVRKRVEQEAELLPLLLGTDLERLEQLRLHLRLMVAHRAAADLPAVQHDVVRLGHRVGRIGFHQRFVTVLGRGERMMPRNPTLAVFVVFEHRKIDDP